MKTIKNYSLKFFLFLICFSLIFYYPINEVKGAITIIEDWESYNVGVDSGSNAYATFYANTDGLEGVISSGGYSGKCCQLRNTGYMYYNLTQTFSHIGKISIWIEGVANICTIKFYNNSYEVLTIDYASTWTYDPIDTTPQTFSVATSTEDGWLNITAIGDNMINYSWWSQTDTTADTKEGASNSIGDWSTITRIKFYVGGTEYYVDNIIFDTGYFGNDNPDVLTGETYCQGSGLISNHYNIKYQYISEHLNSKFTGNLTGLELFISNLQYNLVGHDLTDYEGCINGNSIGYPTSISSRDANEYALVWNNLNMAFNDEDIVLYFWSKKHYTTGGNHYYWYNMPYKNNGENTWGIGFLNSSEFYCIENYAYETHINGDLKLCLYYESYTPVIECYDADSIILSFPNGQFVYNEVYIDYLLIDHDIVDVQIKFDDDGQVDHEEAVECTGNFEYTPDTEGKYTVEINRSGSTVYSVDFWISDNVTPTYNNSKIWANKYRIDVDETFKINWLYNKTYFNNTNGFICWGYTNSLTQDDYDNKMIKNGITGNNINEGVSYNFDDIGNHFIILGYKNGDELIKLDSKRIIVGGEQTTGNHIETNEPPGGFTQVFNPLHGRTLAEVLISGYHEHVGQTVKIKIQLPNNNFMLIPCSYSPFSKTFFAEEGTHYVELILYDGTNETVLDSCSFYVKPLGSHDPGGDGDGDWFTPFIDILTNLPSGIQLLIGFMIIFLFTLAPLGLAHVFSMENIPTLVYLLCAGIGISFSTVLGLIPVWIPFFIIVIAVAWVFMQYINREIGTNGLGGE